MIFSAHIFNIFHSKYALSAVCVRVWHFLNVPSKTVSRDPWHSRLPSILNLSTVQFEKQDEWLFESAPFDLTPFPDLTKFSNYEDSPVLWASWMFFYKLGYNKGSKDHYFFLIINFFAIFFLKELQMVALKMRFRQKFWLYWKAVGLSFLKQPEYFCWERSGFKLWRVGK